MKRRSFIQGLAAAGLTPSLGLLSAPILAATSAYEGPIYIALQADGGWDTTSFCDPKSGRIVPSDSTSSVWINHWGEQGLAVQTHEATGISYAPFADNTNLFQNLANRMLVINGIDSQTNAHNAGVRHVWSGRFSEGHPALTALLAFQNGAGLPLALLSNGGYRETTGLLPYTLMQNPDVLNNLLSPNHPPWSGTRFVRDIDAEIIRQAKLDRVMRMQADEFLSPRLRQALYHLESSAAGRAQLSRLSDFLPDEPAPFTDADGNWHPILRQIQLGLASAASGLTVSLDLVQWGFDTHANHDNDQGIALRQLSDGIQYLWAEAARIDQAHGTNLQGRIRLFVSSEFGRTPWYNDGEGKDHWPVGSGILMQQHPEWRQAVLGASSDAVEAVPLAADLSVSNSGVRIEPRHVQALLRQWVGIQSTLDQRFPLQATDLNLAQILV